MPVDGPSWIYDPPSIAGSVAFVGSGSAENEHDARAAAILNALEEMGIALGRDLVSMYYREFYSTETIEALGTYINSSYTTYGDGEYHCYVLSVTPSSSFYAEQSATIELNMEINEAIAEYLRSASAHYRANEDTAALSDALSALSLSLDGGSYAPSELLNKAMEYLGNIHFEQRNPPSGAIASVKLVRQRGLFPPSVVNGELEATYAMINNNGEIVEDTSLCKSGNRGIASFVVTNPYMVRNGTITFSVHVPSNIIAEIDRKATPGFLDGFKALLHENSITISYSIDDIYPASSTIIAIASHDLDGNIVFEEETLSAFAAQLSSATVNYEIVAASGENEEMMIRSLMSDYPSVRYFIIVYLALSDYRVAFDGYYARVEGSSLIIDKELNEPISTQEIIVADGGATEEEAGMNAFIRGARIAGGMLLKEI